VDQVFMKKYRLLIISTAGRGNQSRETKWETSTNRSRGNTTRKRRRAVEVLEGSSLWHPVVQASLRLCCSLFRGSKWFFLVTTSRDAGREHPSPDYTITLVRNLKVSYEASASQVHLQQFLSCLVIGFCLLIIRLISFTWLGWLNVYHI